MFESSSSKDDASSEERRSLTRDAADLELGAAGSGEEKDADVTVGAAAYMEPKEEAARDRAERAMAMGRAAPVTAATTGFFKSSRQNKNLKAG